MKLQTVLPLWSVLTVALASLAFMVRMVRQERLQGSERRIWQLRIVMIPLVVLMLLGPSIPGGKTEPGMLNINVLFAVDTTASMGAQDYNGSQLRIDGAKKDILALASKMQGAHFSLISFDSSANLLLPLTTDQDALQTAVSTMNREVYARSMGSSIDKPLKLLTEQLQNSKKEHPERSNLLFYLGDGEQTAQSKPQSFASLASYIRGGAVLGYGTSKGAKMLKYSGYNDINDFNDGPYVMTLDTTTYDEVPAISRIDQTALQKIATELHVTYANRDKGGDVNGLFDRSHAQVVADTTRQIANYSNLYWIPAIVLAALMLRELLSLTTRLSELRLSPGDHHE